MVGHGYTDREILELRQYIQLLSAEVKQLKQKVELLERERMHKESVNSHHVVGWEP